MDGASDETSIPDPAAAAEVARLVDDARAPWEGRKLADSEAPLRRAFDWPTGRSGPTTRTPPGS